MKHQICAVVKVRQTCTDGSSLSCIGRSPCDIMVGCIILACLLRTCWVLVWTLPVRYQTLFLVCADYEPHWQVYTSLKNQYFCLIRWYISSNLLEWHYLLLLLLPLVPWKPMEGQQTTSEILFLPLWLMRIVSLSETSHSMLFWAMKRSSVVGKIYMHPTTDLLKEVQANHVCR